MPTQKPIIDKAESRRIRVEIRHVLLEIWDPIGVRDEPHAQDEYDSYIGVIYELLISNASSSDLVDYLWWAVTDHMGLGPKSKSEMNETVRALKAIQIQP